jgi:hypothetical protein
MSKEESRIAGRLFNVGASVPLVRTRHEIRALAIGFVWIELRPFS